MKKKSKIILVISVIVVIVVSFLILWFALRPQIRKVEIFSSTDADGNIKTGSQIIEMETISLSECEALDDRNFIYYHEDTGAFLLAKPSSYPKHKYIGCEL